MDNDVGKASINKLAEHIKVIYKKDPINGAKGIESKLSTISTLLSVIGPLIVSVVCAFSPFKKPDPFTASSFILQNRGVIVLVIVVIVLIISSHVAFGIARDVVNALSSDENNTRIECEELNKENDELKRNMIFFSTAAASMSKNLLKHRGDVLQNLADSMVMAICTDCKGKYQIKSGLAAILYELKENRIRVIGYNQDETHYKVFPEIFRNGVSIEDDEVKDYFCVQCICSKRNNTILHDWKALVKAFIFNWPDGYDKEVIIKNNDREKCKHAGFRFNQYISLRHKMDDGVVWLLEIVALNDETFTENTDSDGLEDIAWKMGELYRPFVSIIWDLAKSTERIKKGG